MSDADGVLPANHEDYFMGYAQPILDWMPAARLSAQAHAKQIGRVCPAESLQCVQLLPFVFSQPSPKQADVQLCLSYSAVG